MGTHYSFSQNPKKLNDWAEVVAERIKLANLPNIMLCYTGMSGISSATALMLKLHEKKILVEMCYVRKPDEESHGNLVELSTTSDYCPSFTKIFVDDFIASADTFRRVEVQCGEEINFLALQTESSDHNLPSWRGFGVARKYTIFYDDRIKTNF